MPATQILVADDDDLIRELISDSLIGAGFRVRQASDGGVAWNIIQNANDLNLLIADIRMPEISGLELTERALQLQPDLRVILITGHPEELPVGESLKAREIRTMVKPFSLDKLCDLAREMLLR